MHVADLYTCTSTGAPSSYFLRGETVYWKTKIVNANGSPVSGASVSTDVYKPNGTLWLTKTDTTDANGFATSYVNTVKNSALGTYTIKVKTVTKSGWTYDSAANVKNQTTFDLQ